MLVKNKNSFTLYIAVLLGILLLLNLIGRNWYKRFDLTDNKMYSLSKSSEKVLDKIDDLLTMKVYFSDDLPGELSNTQRFLQDLLEEYEAKSDNIRFFFTNPESNEELEEEARKDAGFIFTNIIGKKIGMTQLFSEEGNVFPATIIECDNHNLPAAENELFGPVLSVMKFDTEDEVIEKMNDNQYGLSSGVYTSDLARGLRVSKAIRAGITFVNTYRLISPSAPFGGIKDSGYGKEAGIDSIKDFTRVKTTWYYTSDEPTLDPFSIR